MILKVLCVMNLLNIVKSCTQIILKYFIFYDQFSTKDIKTTIIKGAH